MQQNGDRNEIARSFAHLARIRGCGRHGPERYRPGPKRNMGILRIRCRTGMDDRLTGRKRTHRIRGRQQQRGTADRTNQDTGNGRQQTARTRRNRHTAGQCQPAGDVHLGESVFADLRGRRCCPAGGEGHTVRRDTRVERRRGGRRRSLDYRRGGERNVHRIGTGQPRREQAYRKDYRDTLRTVRRSQSGHRGAGGQNRPAVADRHPDRPARMGIRRPQPGLPYRYRRKLHVDGQSRGRRGKSHRLDISHARQKRHAAQRPPRYAQYDRLVPFRIHHHLGRCRRRG